MPDQPPAAEPPSAEPREGALRELEPEPARAPSARRALLAAAAAGAALALALGFGTGLLDGGPSAADLSAAYVEGSDAGAAEAEAEWERETARLERESRQRGIEDGEAAIGRELIIGGRGGYNYEAGLEAGMLGLAGEPGAAFQTAWTRAYREAYERAAGRPPDSVPDPPEWVGETGGGPGR